MIENNPVERIEADPFREGRNEECTVKHKSSPTETYSTTAHGKSCVKGDYFESFAPSEQQIPINLDDFDVSHNSLDMGLGLFPNNDDGALSVSSFCFHDSQENICQRSNSPINMQDSYGNVMNIFGETPSDRNLAVGAALCTDHVVERLVSDEDITRLPDAKISMMNFNDVDPGAEIVTNCYRSDSKADFLKAEDSERSTEAKVITESTQLASNLSSADHPDGKHFPEHHETNGTQSANSFRNKEHQNFLLGKDVLITKSVSSNGGTPPSGNPFACRPNSTSALVSESGTTATGASIRNDGGQQNKDRSYYFVPNTVQVENSDENEEKTGYSYDIAPGNTRSFMHDNVVKPFTVDLNQNSSSGDDKIRQQHMLSYMKWQEENFPQPEPLSRRRVPTSMLERETDFPIPASRARQGRRFSMPALSTQSSNQVLNEQVQEMKRECLIQDSEHQYPRMLGSSDHCQLHENLAHSYSMGNGELNFNAPIPQINRRTQSRRFSMPTFSSSTNSNQDLHDIDSTSYVPRRRQARRLSNDSLSSSVHDHVAHVYSMDVLSGQTFNHDAMDPTGPVRRRQSRRFSNESIPASYESDIAHALSVQTQTFMRQQEGLRFSANAAATPVSPDRRQGRRFSMPIFSSNLQDQGSHGSHLRFQTQQSRTDSSSLLLPLSAVTSHFTPQQINQQINYAVPTTFDGAEKSKSLSSISAYLDVHQECPANYVITPSDRELATDFSFAVLTEVEACTFGKQDRTGKRRSLPLGFQGLACRHCRGLSKIGGRLFPSTIKTMSDTNKTLMALYNHLIKCPVCPNDKKVYLQYLKESHENERKSKRYGSQKALFSKIWKRLHGKCPPI